MKKTRQRTPRRLSGEPVMERLYEFLKSRNLENTIKQFEENKIDPSVILLMGDEDLKKYFPAYGDRLSVVNYCKKMMNGDEKKSKKARLIETLRSKLGTQRRKKKQFDISNDLPDLENNVTYIDQSGLSNLKNPLTVIDIDDIPIDPDDTVQFGPFPSSDEPQDLSETIPTEFFYINNIKPPSTGTSHPSGLCHGRSY
ncbi:hypothetical protein ACJMK2_035187 [Sinanodonta woodiana]|uniref:SAM domain-containing protein n=1 Tax=Sinanodonta woodiana TaxID=1069815 RepID=A0ABD3WU39_SINWO